MELVPPLDRDGGCLRLEGADREARLAAQGYRMRAEHIERCAIVATGNRCQCARFQGRGEVRCCRRGVVNHLNRS